MSLHTKLAKIISFLKMCCTNKHSIVKYKKDTILLKILEQLREENLINGFIEDTNANEYHIYLKYNHLGESVITRLFLFYKNPFILNMTVNQLKSNHFKKTYIMPHGKNQCIIFLSTDKGILSVQNCIKNNIGGLLLFVIICK